MKRSIRAYDAVALKFPPCLLSLSSAAMLMMALHAGPAFADTTLPMPSAFQTCAGCHSVKPAENFDAPSLAGVYGRHAGTEPGYSYSTAMKNSKIIWDAATLDAYLTAPQKVVPNNQMAFAGLPDPRARAEIIRYLRSLSNN